jgi:hypothetical protein
MPEVRGEDELLRSRRSDEKQVLDIVLNGLNLLLNDVLDGA